MADTAVATKLDSAALDALRQNFRGPLVTPADSEYGEARKLWNAMIGKRPALIARCTGTADVAAALGFAREHGLEVAVRGGGHSVSGNSTTDGGVLVDLSLMRGVRVDPDAKRAWVQGGALLGDVDRETNHFGLVSPGGTVSHTGVAGLTLGGGHGWTQRKFGMACDNVVAYDVVTASGEFVRATEDENADLFWGLRGGGGNFGIVTSFEFRLHEMNPIIYGGPILYSTDDGPKVLELFREICAEAPDELTCIILSLSAPPLEFIPEPAHGKPAIALASCYIGDHADGERLTKRLRTVAQPIADVLGPMPYTMHQSSLDDWLGHGLHRYWKSHYLDEITDRSIDAWVAHAAELTGGKAMSGSYIQHLGGAIARAGEDDSAYAHRGAEFDFTAMAGWVDPADTDENMAWCRSLWEGLGGKTKSVVYVNNLGDEGADRVRAAYGDAKYERLVALKRTYDPDNVFHLNQNIKP